MLGLNDTVIIKSKVHTTDGRGGATTALTTKIASLTCSIQPDRREESSFQYEGQTVIDPNILMYENITSGPVVEIGDIVIHGSDSFVVLTVSTLTGLGTHSEAILKSINNDAHLE